MHADGAGVRLVWAGVLAAVLCAVVLVAGAEPAHAHGRGSDATNYSSTITRVPDLDGVDWRMWGGDEFLSVDNRSGRELVILGYQGEPYVRVGPGGVWENRNSPATYQNADRLATTEVPPTASAEAEPDWRKVSDGTSYAWHDHRTHWMSPAPPAQVADDPGRQQTIGGPWAVDFRYAGRVWQVRGQLRWVPGPSPWPWLAAGLAVTLPALAGWRPNRRRVDRVADLRGLARPAALVLGVVAAANLIHLVDDFLATPLPLASRVLAAVQTAMFIAIALFGAERGWQCRDGAFTALLVGSGALLVGQGLLYVPVLTSSQSASLFPDPLARLVVAASIAQVVGVGSAGVAGSRRLTPLPASVGEPAADARA